MADTMPANENGVTNVAASGVAGAGASGTREALPRIGVWVTLARVATALLLVLVWLVVVAGCVASLVVTPELSLGTAAVLVLLGGAATLAAWRLRCRPAAVAGLIDVTLGLVMFVPAWWSWLSPMQARVPFAILLGAVAAATLPLIAWSFRCRPDFRSRASFRSRAISPIRPKEQSDDA